MQGAAKFIKPSEKSKNTNELMQILSSAKTPEELQAYTKTLKQEHISCSFADFISEKLREQELSAADLSFQIIDRCQDHFGIGRKDIRQKISMEKAG